MNDTLKRLENAIKKYRNRTYSESDFHMTIASIESLITEIDKFDLKDLLMTACSSLEHIDFMVNINQQREEYITIIERIEKFLRDHHYED